MSAPETLARNSFVAGVDLGGTKILTLIAGRDLKVAASDTRPTQAGDGPDAVIERLIASVRAAAAGRPLDAIGISTPGPCDPKRGVVTAPPNLPGWVDVPLAARIAAAFGVPAWLENDANCAVIAEHEIGGGRGVDHMVLVTLGTGIGGGLILNGRLYSGASGGAGEIGHMKLEPAGPLCGCGRHGCLEAIASGYAIEREGRAVVKAEPEGLLARLAKGEPATAETVARAATGGDASAARVIERAGRYLGAGLTNIVDVFNPQLIVLSGNLRKLGAPYLDPALAVIEAEAYKQHRNDVHITETALGDEAGALGACLLALDKLVESTSRP